MGTLNITLLGTSFTIQTDEPDERLNLVFHYYHALTKEAAVSGLTDPLQIAIMAGLSAVEETYRVKEDAAISEKTSLNEKKAKEAKEDAQLKKLIAKLAAATK